MGPLQMEKSPERFSCPECPAKYKPKPRNQLRYHLKEHHGWDQKRIDATLPTLYKSSKHERRLRQCRDFYRGKKEREHQTHQEKQKRDEDAQPVKGEHAEAANMKGVLEGNGKIAIKVDYAEGGNMKKAFLQGSDNIAIARGRSAV